MLAESVDEETKDLGYHSWSKEMEQVPQARHKHSFCPLKPLRPDSLPFSPAMLAAKKSEFAQVDWFFRWTQSFCSSALPCDPDLKSKEQLHAAWCDGELVAFRERVFIFWETVPIASGLPGGPQGTQSLKELWQAHMRACRPQVRTPREQFIFTTLQTVSVGVSIEAWKTSVWQTPCLQSLQEHDRMPDLWPDVWHWVSHLTTKNFIVCCTKWRPKVT